jgi:hypothetical protein
MVLPVEEAASVNLPGSIRYPAYSVMPTEATRGGSIINPNYLSLESEARALMTELGADGLVDEGDSARFPIIYPENEPRRSWALLIQSRPVNAGLLLFARNQRGIGSPGSWDLSGADPVWVPAAAAPTGENDARPQIDMPCRDLASNERLEAGLMGLPQVRRLDMTAAPASAGFTEADRLMLRQIWDAVR